jgi:DNA modification methylase
MTNPITIGDATLYLGDCLCHENEAPFPEALAEFFVRSFCPPGGTVLDPFSGSGTTTAVALRHGRRAIGIDVRQSQIDLVAKRLAGGPLLAQEGGEA